MAIPFLNNIDLSDNQLLNAKLQVTSPAPTAAAGQIYYNSVSNTAQYYNGTAWIELVASTGGTVTSVTSGNTNTITVGGTATDPTISANTAAVANGSLNLATGDQIYDFVIGQGYVESVGSNNSTFVNLVDSGTATDPNLTASLSATGTADNTTFLRGDNTWATPINTNTTYDLDSIQVGSDVAITLVGSDVTVDPVTLVAGTNITLTDDGSANITIDASNPDQTVTLTGEVTGTGTTSIPTTVADGVLDVANFNASAIVTAAEGIENNDNDTTLPTSASVKAYVDASVVGGLVYQGGFDGSNGYVAGTTNYLDNRGTQIAVNKGWTYTVTVAGTFYGENVEIGDVLIAEDDLASGTGALTDWTTVQNNVDLASASQIGIGNVVAGSGVDVSYASGTATISLTAVAATSGSIAVPTSTTYTYPNSITASSTNNVLIQLVDSNGETVYADVQRLSTTTFSVDYGVTEPTGVVALIQLIG